MGSRVRTQPCEACPYRRDVASGVWAQHEYEKLVDYDRPTGEQPFQAFACHATPDFLCHGWAVVHNNRGHEHELLALRLESLGGEAIDIPNAKVPLFASGAEAAEHGMRDIETPSEEAIETVVRLQMRYGRLRD